MSKRKRYILELGFMVLFFDIIIESKCNDGCDLALASYYVVQGSNLTYISKIFAQPIPDILNYNPNISSSDSIEAGARINVPFSCLCLNGDFLGHTFKYQTQIGDTYGKIATDVFANLTTEYWIQRVNWFEPAFIPDFVDINVTVNCTCGNKRVSKNYGLFSTYPLRQEDTLQSLATESGVSTMLLERFNVGSNFSAGSGIVFVPTKANVHLSATPIIPTRKFPILLLRFFTMKMESRIKSKLLVYLFVLMFVGRAESSCNDNCISLASYLMWEKSNLTFVSQIFSTTIPHILTYNPQITNADIVHAGSRINVPFSCGCDDRGFLSHRFVYNVSSGSTYSLIAKTYYSELTTVNMMRKFNNYDELNIPLGGQVNVIINCSCGSSRVSKDYGLFITYPIRRGENISTIANDTGFSEHLLRNYNPGSNFSEMNLVFIPGRDQNGTFPPLKSSTKGLSGAATAGISVGAVTGVLFFGICIYLGFYRRRKIAEGSLLDENGTEQIHGSGFNLGRTTESGPLIGGAQPGMTGITVDKSVEFSYDELAKATDEFSLDNKIGQGGFGVVYYGELRGEKAAIKKMDMQASKEFLAELKVLTHVHHLNLVRLLGYCVEGSLFLVYEFIENGNLSQHLRDSSGREPIPWATRVQIALDSARGLEYIHEHTVPVYIHRDIKSPNILIDENFRAKVADFGLAKLTEVGSGSLQTRLVGTFGYMPPEYAQYGEVSPKVDVYAFGVVMFELISAKEAVVKTNEHVCESKGLVGLFEEVLSTSDPGEGLSKLVDPRLGADYPLESVRKVALLARACTHDNPQLRPSMRSIVVALMTLSSSTEDWDVGSFYENQELVQMMSGR
uniref:chitin elicitor receptor kinase 1-like n=1 Tax=Erigeron canadensis TaxID=72917 RepID=UPI001CB90C6D|nr:chitin elicitor receptor kinase 1-like [Erigeron canadensis]